MVSSNVTLLSAVGRREAVDAPCWQEFAKKQCAIVGSPQPTLRSIYAVSDVHAEYRENMQWCEELSDSYRNDVLIVAGEHLSVQPSPSP